MKMIRPRFHLLESNDQSSSDLARQARECGDCEISGVELEFGLTYSDFRNERSQRMIVGIGGVSFLRFQSIPAGKTWGIAKE